MRNKSKAFLVLATGSFVAIALVKMCMAQPTDSPAPRFRANVAPQLVQRQLQPAEQPTSELMKEVPFRDWTIREISADSLWRIGRPAVPALIEALSDTDPYVRVLAARSLAYIGQDAEPAVPALIAALEDPNEAVRQTAARALGQIGPEAADAVPALIERMRAPRK